MTRYIVHTSGAYIKQVQVDKRQTGHVEQFHHLFAYLCWTNETADWLRKNSRTSGTKVTIIFRLMIFLTSGTSFGSSRYETNIPLKISDLDELFPESESRKPTDLRYPDRKNIAVHTGYSASIRQLFRNRKAMSWWSKNVRVTLCSLVFRTTQNQRPLHSSCRKQIYASQFPNV